MWHPPIDVLNVTRIKIVLSQAASRMGQQGYHRQMKLILHFVDSSFISVWSVMMRTHLVSDCDIRDTEEVGDTMGTLWGHYGHLSPSNPRHWDTLVKVTQLSSALAAKIQLISSDNHSELRCSPLIGCWDSSLSSHWLRHELLVNLIHDLWYTFPRYWHWHTAHCQYEEFRKIISRNLMKNCIYCKI